MNSLGLKHIVSCRNVISIEHIQASVVFVAFCLVLPFREMKNYKKHIILLSLQIFNKENHIFSFGFLFLECVHENTK